MDQAGFEPVTFSLPRSCATRPRHKPMVSVGNHSRPPSEALPESSGAEALPQLVWCVDNH